MPQLVGDFASTDGIVPPDLAVAKSEGIIGLVPRGTYGRPYGGQTPVYKDPVWELNKNRIKNAGLLRSTYTLVCVPRKGLTTPEPEVQAQQFYDYAAHELVPPQPGKYCKDFVPYLDVEEQSDRLTADEYYDWILRFAKTLRDLLGGYWPGIYDSNRVWQEYLNGHAAGDLKACFRWFAKPWPYAPGQPADLTGCPKYSPTVPPQFGDATAWGWYQYQGDAANAPGFKGYIDLSRPQFVAQGAKGDVVKWIQRAAGATIDGDFGPKTAAAVAAYQTSYGLTPDSQVGIYTQAPMSWVPFAA